MIQPNANEACHIDHTNKRSMSHRSRLGRASNPDMCLILIYVTCPIYTCYTSYSSVFLGVTRFVHLRDMPHVPVQCASFMCVAWLSICLTWLIHMCEISSWHLVQQKPLRNMESCHTYIYRGVIQHTWVSHTTCEQLVKAVRYYKHHCEVAVTKEGTAVHLQTGASLLYTFMHTT